MILKLVNNGQNLKRNIELNDLKVYLANKLCLKNKRISLNYSKRKRIETKAKNGMIALQIQ